jgi:hypothetical protein
MVNALYTPIVHAAETARIQSGGGVAADMAVSADHDGDFTFH